MTHISKVQRYTISALLDQGKTQLYISEYIGKSKSSISREIRRNCDKRSGKYKADLADKKYKHRQKTKVKRQSFTEDMQSSIVKLLEEEYSPEQVVGTLLQQGRKCVSHERIYQFIWSDKRQGGNLYTHLRQKERRHIKRANSKDNRGLIKDRISIIERPAIVDERERFGDLEVDLIIGKSHKQALVTVNDRASGMVLIRKVNDKKAETVSEAIIEILEEWKSHLHTLTSDNGKEFAYHLKVSKELNLNYYFAHPYSSWERGSNENLNGLIRQYFPKGTSFNNITDEQVKAVETKLNNRPRKRFNFDSPNIVMKNLLEKLNNRNLT